MIWPTDFAVYYPFPKSIPIWEIALATIVLCITTLFICLRIKKNPWLFVGWFWYLGTLFPVIGLIQHGLWPAIADRWAYVPLIGIYIIIFWSVEMMINNWKFKNVFIKISMTGVIVSLALLSFIQTGHWKNTITLFEHSLKITGYNDKVCNNLGVAYVQANENDRAIFHFKKALELNPHYKEALFNYANALFKKGNTTGAINYFKKALKLDPEYLEAHNDLGIVLANTGNLKEALLHFKKAIKINPADKDASANLKYTLSLIKTYEER